MARRKGSQDQDNEHVLYYASRAELDAFHRHWWVTTSWSALIATVLVIVGGAIWLFALVRRGQAEVAAIVYPLTVAIAGSLCVIGWIGTAVAMAIGKTTEAARNAIIPWSFGLLLCAVVVLAYWARIR